MDLFCFGVIVGVFLWKLQPQASLPKKMLKKTNPTFRKQNNVTTDESNHT